MPERGAAAEALPVVERPAIRMDHRRDEKRWIGDAPGDDHRCVRGERRHHLLGAEVSIRGNELAVLRQGRAARFDGAHRRLEQREHVVAAHDGDLEPQAELARQRHDAPPGVKRIGRAPVGDDAKAVAHGEGQQRAHARLEQRVEAGARVREPAQLGKRDGPLGEAFEHEVIELALRGEDDGGLEPVALEAAARPDAHAIRAGYRPASRASPSARLRSG